PEIMLLGISGATSCGKSTVVKILSRLLDNVAVIHQDDFYKADDEIPVRDGVADWDCKEAIKVDELYDVLAEARATGNVKEHTSFEGKLDKFSELVNDNELQLLAAIVNAQTNNNTKIIIVDGFMLYLDDRFLNLFDKKYLVHAPYHVLKARRENRKGYYTEQGFWEDPKGYFDKIVWPAYVEENGKYFKD
ncbi:hypothetical protein CANCADRAFT_15924, partial [Tortispora caseinolytica NRRL Y-17796]